MRRRPKAYGLSAPQLGELQRLAFVDTSKLPRSRSQGRLVLINPVILEWKGIAVGRESCLSVPSYRGTVIRAKRIKVSAFDEHGVRHTITSSGLEARAIQHEIDHLDGLLFIDRVVSRQSDLSPKEQDEPFAPSASAG